MNYAIEILKERLGSERLAHGHTKEWLMGSGVDDGKDSDDIIAFRERLSLAERMIPQLEDAIEILSKQDK